MDSLPPVWGKESFSCRLWCNPDPELNGNNRDKLWMEWFWNAPALVTTGLLFSSLKGHFEEHEHVLVCVVLVLQLQKNTFSLLRQLENWLVTALKELYFCEGFFFCNEYVAVLILRQKLFQNIPRGKSANISCSTVCDSSTAQQWRNPLFSFVFPPLTWNTQMHDGKHDIGMIYTSHLNLLVPPEDLLLRNFGVNKWEKGKGCLLFIFIIKNTAAKERHVILEINNQKLKLIRLNAGSRTSRNMRLEKQVSPPAVFGLNWADLIFKLWGINPKMKYKMILLSFLSHDY